MDTMAETEGRPLSSRSFSFLSRTGPPDALWDAKVRELAFRSMSLGAILGFYKALPGAMRFDPELTRTADVVRHVIIPASASRTCAFADLPHLGTQVPPTRMVTHNWSNRFCSLVAAVVADALQLATYADIEARLEPGLIDELLSDLEDDGLLGLTYWICAFCVNQHTLICGPGPEPDAADVEEHAAWLDRLDTCRQYAEKKGYSLCHCSRAKVFNTTPPTVESGESALCEANKFPEMMELLSKAVPDFSQLVVVDKDFRLFQRAWCVAELAQARACGITQRIKISSQEDLDRHRPALKRLDVSRMQASRPEDVAMILAKIPDVASFNAELQALVCDDSKGLLAMWDVEKQMQKLMMMGQLVSQRDSRLRLM